jgi:hypothetical protein
MNEYKSANPSGAAVEDTETPEGLHIFLLTQHYFVNKLLLSSFACLPNCHPHYTLCVHFLVHIKKYIKITNIFLNHYMCQC